MIQLTFGPFINTMSGTFTTSAVSGVIVDCYAASGAVPAVGQGAYGGVSGVSGLCYVNFNDFGSNAWLARSTYPAGAFDSTQPSFVYSFIEEIYHWDQSIL